MAGEHGAFRAVETPEPHHLRTRQILRAAQHEFVGSWDEITTLPKELREQLSAEVPFSTLTVDPEELSSDGSVKLRLTTHDSVQTSFNVHTEVDERLIVLLRVGNEVFAIDDVCTHDGGPLSEGELNDHTIACPRHGAKFDIRTGKATEKPCRFALKAYKVVVIGDELHADLS